MKNNFDLTDYQLIKDKKESNIYLKIVLFLIITGILIIIYKFEFKVYDKKVLIKNEENYILLINSKQINDYKNKKYIYINQKKYAYDIIKVDDNYTNINDNIYQNLYLNLYNYKTDALVTECYFLVKKSTIYNELIKFIKGE